MAERAHMKTCKHCGLEKPKNEFQIEKSHCKVCEYLKQHSDLKILPNWTIEQYKIILDLILNDKIKNINQLEDILNIPLSDIVLLLREHLKIANKQMDLLYNCDNCKKEFVIKVCKTKNKRNIFCCRKCYWEFKRQWCGQLSPSYQRVLKTCTMCKKSIEVIPFDDKKLNKFGDNHNFCSYECYWKYRSKYYVGEKAVMTNYVFSQEQRDAMRIRNAKAYSNGVFNTETKPQRIVNDILDELEINYIREKQCKYYAVDNYLSDFNLIIEVMGDYFHSNPLKFTKLNTMQQNGIKRDKSKRTYIDKYYGIKILYLWEYDILKNPDVCKSLILEYIKNEGILHNYNSFNYFLDTINNIKLFEKIICPYFEMSNKNP